MPTVKTVGLCFGGSRFASSPGGAMPGEKSPGLCFVGLPSGLRPSGRAQEGQLTLGALINQGPHFSVWACPSARAQEGQSKALQRLPLWGFSLCAPTGVCSVARLPFRARKRDLSCRPSPAAID
jgi:hypothetical protein